VFRYIIRRLVFSIPVLIISSVLVFLVVHLTQDPTKALYINPRITPKDIARIKHQLGLDKSGWQQYTAWLTHFVRGDWGSSLISQRPVAKDIREALVNSAVLGFAGTGIALVVGVLIGVYSAIRQYSMFDNIATTGAFVALSIPNFWFAVLLQIFFGIYLTKWFHLSYPLLPVAGISTPGSVGFHLIDRIRHLILPALVLAVQILAVYSRYMRASMLDVLHSDYLRTARAKGLRERRVIVRHAMRNALIPITTQLAIDIGLIASGLIITEGVFQYTGMGYFFLKAMANGDYPQILPWLMVTVASVIIFNLIADVMYAVLDPRIRYA
jgi:peptide/nickel transport system permease protein